MIAFRPDYAVHPGEVLKEALKERGWSQRKLCRVLGMSPPYVCDLTKGYRGFGPVIALRIEAALGISAKLLLNLQADYDLWHNRRSDDLRRELVLIAQRAAEESRP